MTQLTFVQWQEAQIRDSFASVSEQIRKECDDREQPYDYEEEDHYAEQAEFSIDGLKEVWS